MRKDTRNITRSTLGRLEARFLSKIGTQSTFSIEQAEGKASKRIVKVVVLTEDGKGFEINTDHTNQVKIHRVKTQRQDLGV